MANCNITSRTPIAESFFSAISYIPPVPTRTCVFRQFSPSINLLKSMGYMETLCAHIINLPTSIKANPDKARLIIEVLPMKIQLRFSPLGKRQQYTLDALSP